jgi:hypothetical protein
MTPDPCRDCLPLATTAIIWREMCRACLDQLAGAVRENERLQEMIGRMRDDFRSERERLRAELQQERERYARAAFGVSA